MVFLVLTPSGLLEAMTLANGRHAVWCCPSAVTDADFQSRRFPNLTRFEHVLAGATRGGLQLAQALDTIAQHHPGERVWTESSNEV